MAARLDGRKGWTLPLEPLTVESLEPELPENTAGGEEAARHEALFALASNGPAVARFCARAAGGEILFSAASAGDVDAVSRSS